MSELAIVRTLVPSIAGVGVFIFVVLTLANASDGDSGMSAGACAVSAMSPIMVMSSLAGFDNQNGWERYRATLPFSRKDIICARYLSVIVFSALMACAATLLSIASIPLFNSAGIPSTGQTVFEIAIASAASMLISLMMVFLAQPTNSPNSACVNPLRRRASFIRSLYAILITSKYNSYLSIAKK